MPCRNKCLARPAQSGRRRLASRCDDTFTYIQFHSSLIVPRTLECFRFDVCATFHHRKSVP
ncbi:hypothetical protein EMIT0324P_10652 [Pseudomonas chlororaphis]